MTFLKKVSNQPVKTSLYLSKSTIVFLSAVFPKAVDRTIRDRFVFTKLFRQRDERTDRNIC